MTADAQDQCLKGGMGDLVGEAAALTVFAAYGWTGDLSDEEILEKLLALNLERAKATGG